MYTPYLLELFDSEMIYDIPEDYGSLLEDLQPLLRGAARFEAVHITDASFDHPNFTITFTLNQQRYTIPMEYTGDYVEWYLIDEINRILAEAGIPKQFCFLYTSDQCAALLCLHPEKVSYAHNHSLLPLTHLA